MKESFRTIEWAEGRVRLLDQTLLPLKEEYIEIRSVGDMCDAIRRLVVRGAPAIGVAAAMGIALGVQDAPESDMKSFADRFEEVCQQITGTRPTAVNLFWAAARMRSVFNDFTTGNIRELKDKLVQEALRIEREDRELCERIGAWGETVLEDGETVLTHCNAGGLATAGYGTALGVIRAAVERGKDIHVVADETRPLNQGARITCWELKKLGIPVTLIPDNTAGVLMRRGEIHKVVVGADRIANNGDTANKIGTYSVAVLASYHKIPFYVAAPLSTIDRSLETGAGIPIEERDPNEVTHIGGVRIAPEGIQVRNMAFDVTPSHLITGIITEYGIAAEPYRDAFEGFFTQHERGKSVR